MLLCASFLEDTLWPEAVLDITVTTLYPMNSDVLVDSLLFHLSLQKNEGAKKQRSAASAAFFLFADTSNIRRVWVTLACLEIHRETCRDFLAQELMKKKGASRAPESRERKEALEMALQGTRFFLAAFRKRETRKNAYIKTILHRVLNSEAKKENLHQKEKLAAQIPEGKRIQSHLAFLLFCAPLELYLPVLAL